MDIYKLNAICVNLQDFIIVFVVITATKIIIIVSPIISFFLNSLKITAIMIWLIVGVG